jgi:diguanylate cyclase (GGDEF)-like protein
MQRYVIAEPPEATLGVLEDALDLVDFGIILLNRDLRARLINRRLIEMWSVPPELLATPPSFRDLLNDGAARGRYAVPAAEMPDYLDQREAQVRAGSIPPILLDVAGRRRILFSCVTCADGGRALTYIDITSELRQETSDAVARISAERRFSSETLEDQASHLASLAEAAEESAQNAERARCLLEHEIAERRQLEIKLRQMAAIDALTGALSRAELLRSAQHELEVGQLAEKKLTVLMLDVDHFKAINDSFGHAGGDRALETLVGTLRPGIRQIDLLGRLGGEEFAIVLPDTPPAAAERVAERLRVLVEGASIPFGDRLIRMTVSIGLADQLETDRSIEQVIARADDALYRAKHAGRNRVIRDHRSTAPDTVVSGRGESAHCAW